MEICIFAGGTTTGVSPLKNTGETANITYLGDSFKLTYPLGITSFSLYNSDGKYLCAHSLDTGGSYLIPANSLDRGVYLLKLNGEKEMTLKLLK
jgi:hypothetical protein